MDQDRPVTLMEMEKAERDLHQEKKALQCMRDALDMRSVTHYLDNFVSLLWTEELRNRRSALTGSLGEALLNEMQKLNDFLRQTYTSICRRGDCTLVFSQVRTHKRL
eukprot:TRINITY_DN62649_c0_g1_i1.p1 TRINITY_DN62649_c0_g1~~TRINITY_DN62649_c0_g1_i1.p1  ORF type:complete len:120 (-),score=21.85 TRINITY_DN62649_c0_g1_i1:209-529(-)